MRVISVTNHKGGVGKTTSTVNIAAALNMLGKKILLIDLDPQAQLTYSVGIKDHEQRNSIYEFIKGDLKFNEVVINQDNIDVIPSSLNLSGADIELSSIAGRERLLSHALNGVDGYDFILLDCPPSLGLLTLNALTASKEIFIPIQPEFLALQGMSKLIRFVDVVIERLNKDLQITGIIITRYNKRRKLNNEVIEKIKEYFENKIFKTPIRENISLAEAPSFGQSIFQYNAKSHGAEDYLNLSKEIMERGEI
ncbi:MAG: ParA family protein [Spirochaetota bacterium]|nr:ParA family protein [Spirochaetota bacterium]